MAGLRTNNGAGSVNLGAAAPGMVGRTTIHVESLANPITAINARGNGSVGTYRAAKVLSSLDPTVVAAATIAAAGVYHIEGDLEVQITFGAGATVYSVSQTGSG